MKNLLKKYMFQFLETIKISDGKVMYPEQHRQRIHKTLTDFYKEDTFPELPDIIKIPEQYLSGIAKCRLLYDRYNYDIQFELYTQRKIKSLKLLHCNEIDYKYKYADRLILENCLKQKDDCDDIIIVKNGFLTDASYANLIFGDGSNWFTPSTYLLNGTCRQRLLKTGAIKEVPIKVEDINNYKYFKLINAMIYPEDSDEIGVGEISK
jgi:4-amino-4-deoxychorismate lyase